VINQSESDVCRSTVFEHVLPESEIGQERAHVALEFTGVRILSLWVILHLSVVGKRQYERQALLRMQDR
jgi:hypothetical protein